MKHAAPLGSIPLCLPATSAHEPTFHEWFEKGCRRSPSAPLKEATIFLAVRRGSAGDDWLALEGRGIYLQVLDEEDGRRVWDSDNRLLVLVWYSDAELAVARQPVMLQCRITTSKAGQNSQLRGTNQSVAPAAGFEAVIRDDVELTAQQSAQRGRRPTVRLWSGREVQVYDCEYSTAHVDSSQVDGNVRSKYQIMACLTEVLIVEPKDAKVLPYSNADRLKVGKRISTHPLHETFLGLEWKEKKLRDEYYQRSEPGALVAELDSPADSGAALECEEVPEGLSRLQRVFTTPVDQLIEAWRDAAQLLRSRKSASEQHGKETRSPWTSASRGVKDIRRKPCQFGSIGPRSFSILHVVRA